VLREYYSADLYGQHGVSPAHPHALLPGAR
jgi:hypothetical protein